MRTASVVLAAVAAVVFATGRAADRTPAYITAAVADLARPAADRERDATRKPDECVAFAGLKPGDRIADIFPGRGYYSRIFSNVVGPKGHEFFSTRGGAQPIEIIGAVQLNFTYSVQPVLETVEDTARQFLTFMRTHYEAHYADSKIPEEYRDGPLFLVGGYSRADHLPSLYRVNVQKNAITPMYAAGNFGLAWEGQSDAVERLIRGYDSDLRSAFERQITAGIETLRKALIMPASRWQTASIRNFPPVHPLRFRGTVIGAILHTATCRCRMLLTWYRFWSERSSPPECQRGRTHIGVITKANGFRMLGEPDLHRTYVGFT
jgi:hypothetical protein